MAAGARVVTTCWDGPIRTLLAAVLVVAGPLIARLDPGDRAADPGVGEFRVDPNTAPEPVLAALPRIGPAIVSALVEARAARPFDSLDDLDRRVRGVGPATRASIAPHLRFEPASTGR